MNIKDMKDASIRFAKTAQDNYYVVCNLFESGSPDWPYEDEECICEEKFILI